MFMVNCVMFAGLGFQIYGWFSDLPFEVDNVWRRPASLSVKFRYLWSKYIGLVVHIVYTIFYVHSQSLETVPSKVCRALHGLMSFSFHTLLLCLSLTLRHREIHRAIDIVMGLEFTVCTAWAALIGQRVELRGACLIQSIPRDSFYFMVVQVLFQATIWTLVSLRFDIAGPTKFMIRETSPIFIATFVLLLSMLATTRLSNHYRHFEISHLFSSLLPLTVVTIASVNCYLIKNMELEGRRAPDPQNNPATELNVIVHPESAEETATNGC